MYFILVHIFLTILLTFWLDLWSIRNLHRMTGHCATGDEYGLAGVPASPCPGAHRRRTDLMPAILIRSQAGGQSTAPNTPGRAVSLSRIDGAAAVCKQPRPSMASSKSMSHLAAQKKTQGFRPTTTTANGTNHVRAKTGGNLPRKQGRLSLSLSSTSL